MTLMFVLSGCTNDPGEQTAQSEADPVIHTAPGANADDANASRTDRAHLHDYWRGQDVVRILDDMSQDVTVTWDGPPISVAVFRPLDKDVVPLGTERIQVTVAWTADEPSMYDTPELWVQDASDAQPRQIGVLENGGTLEIETTNDDADLPHQLLSAWEFHIYMAVPDDAPLLRFDGEISIDAHAHRGLDIPLFPAHPDVWQNSTEWTLFDHETELPYYQGTPEENPNCFGGCFRDHAPDDGIVVPYDADRVELTITYGNAPQPIGLRMHGADTRTWTRLSPDAEDDTTQTYVVALEDGMGDGPYAKQSQWVFRPDTGDAGFTGSYRAEATVHRHAE